MVSRTDRGRCQEGLEAPGLGVRLPPTLAGLQRSAVSFFSHQTLDVAGQYGSADGNDIVTLYLYRNTNGSVPVWFDRARYFILNLPDKYGAAKGLGARSFAPRGQAIASGLLETFSVQGKYRTSTLAVFPLGEFYVKARASSKVRDEAGVEALLLQALHGIHWTSKASAAAAMPVLDCTDTLPVRAAAKELSVSSDDRMMAGLLGGLFASLAVPKDGRKAKTSQPPLAYCREPGSATLPYGIYRPGGDKERFLMAVHDGGRGISVGRNGLAELFGGAPQRKSSELPVTPRYTVSFIDLNKTANFTDFASLPLPEQALQLVEKGQSISVTQTWGKKREISITP